MSTVKIEFIAPNSTVYAIESSDDSYRGLCDSGEELIDRVVYAIKRATGMTNG